MDPTGRFSERAADYVKYRPDYPAAAIDAVLAGLAPPAALAIADIGAGTGISARLLADRGARVVAIEPNADMRAAATAHPGVDWRDSTAEATGLATASQDLVTCFQAFHWFRPRESVAEFRRVLRAGGRLALVWNVRDDRDAPTRGYIDAIHAVAGTHPAELRELEAHVLDGQGWFAPPRTLTFPHAQWLDAPGLLGRAASSSYVRREPAAWREIQARLLELHARHRDAQSKVALRYVTEVHLTEAR